MTQALSWSNLGINLKHGTKYYWKKYLYKMELQVDLATYLRDKNNALVDDEVRNFTPPFNYNFGSWFYNYYKEPAKDSQIEEVIAVGLELRRHSDIKYVVDHCTIYVYATSEDTLLQIAVGIRKNMHGDLRVVQNVYVPDPALLNDIKSDCEILKTDVGYSHKIVLRESAPGADAKKQILSYLDTLGIDTVKVSDSVRETMKSNHPYIYSCWFRTNDPSIATFIELMSPGLISKIYKTVVKN